MKPFGFTAIQMTQSTSHRRSPSSPHTSKTKLSRPNLHRRGTSAINVSISKLGAGIGHSRASSKDDDAEVAMAASFLNFCATCENQITTPDNSLLYCSEKCRNKDSCKPLSASKPSLSTTDTSTPPPNSPTNKKPRNIVSPMKPTTRSPVNRKPAKSFDGIADMDPTEWKPALRSATSLGSSDAWAYLSTFYGSESLPARRNRSVASLPGRIETMEAHAHANMPPLTHTPDTPTSSFSSDSSVDINLDDVSLTLNNIKCSPRTSKGVDLVTPLENPVPVVVVDGPDAWENTRETHHPHSLSAPIAIVRAPHARVRTA